MGGHLRRHGWGDLSVGHVLGFRQGPVRSETWRPRVSAAARRQVESGREHLLLLPGTARPDPGGGARDGGVGRGRRRAPRLVGGCPFRRAECGGRAPRGGWPPRPARPPPPGRGPPPW